MFMTVDNPVLAIDYKLDVAIKKDGYLLTMVFFTSKCFKCAPLFYHRLILKFNFILFLVEEQVEEIVLPLHEAARRGNISFLREGLSSGVSGTGLDSAGNTPLYWAARAGHEDCVKLLLEIPNPAVNAQVVNDFIKTQIFLN